MSEEIEEGDSERRDREIMERMLELNGLRNRISELEAEKAWLNAQLMIANSPVDGPEVTRELLAGGRYREPIEGALRRLLRDEHVRADVRRLLAEAEGARPEHRDPWHPPECGGFQGNGD